MDNDITNNFINDPEYSWLIQTCMNVFNVGLTMIHLTACDYMRELRMNDDNCEYFGMYEIN